MAFANAVNLVGAFSATKSPLYSDRLDKLQRKIPELLAQLEAVVGDSEEKSLVISKIRSLASEALQLLKARTNQIIDGTDTAMHRARHTTNGLRDTFGEVEQQLRILTQEERMLDSEQSDAIKKERLKLNTVLKLGFLGSLFFSLAMIATSTSTKSQNSQR